MLAGGTLLAEWFNGPQRQLYGLYPLTRAVVGSLDLFRVIALTLTQIVDWHASGASTQRMDTKRGSALGNGVGAGARSWIRCASGRVRKMKSKSSRCQGLIGLGLLGKRVVSGSC